MGVPVGEATGDAVMLVACPECEEHYEIDETMSNDCPECGRISHNIIDAGSPVDWRRLHDNDDA